MVEKGFDKDKDRSKDEPKIKVQNTIIIPTSVILISKYLTGIYLNGFVAPEEARKRR